MPNPLTGDFDAVVQLAVRQANGLLATLHQNGLSADATLKLLHSVRGRIGDEPGKPSEVGAFGDWVLAYQNARPEGPRRPVQDLLVATSPPGAATRLEATFNDLELVPVPPPPDAVSGRGGIQLSTVRLGVIDGSTSEVVIHTDVRVLYEPVPGTTPLPAAIHGEVKAVLRVRKTVSGGKSLLVIKLTNDDEKIEFIPASGSGLTSTDTGRIAAQVRKFLRKRMNLIPVELPKEFPFADFKGLGTGTNAAIALPLQLSDTPAPAAGADSITQSLVEGSGFAFAVSGEHVKGLIDFEAIRDEIKKTKITIPISSSLFGAIGDLLGADFLDVTYRLRFSSGPTLTFQAGAIEVAGRVEVEPETFGPPSGSVSFKQRIILALDTVSQRVDPEADGEPDVDTSFFIPHDRAAAVVKSQIAKALALNRSSIRAVFRDARTGIQKAVRSFDGTASAACTAIEISPHGVIVRGEVGTASRLPPILIVEETKDRQAFTAFNSWIPGGRIDRFTWSWVEFPTPRPSPWSGVAKSVTETARFILPKPSGITEISQICLRVSGERLLPDGRPQAVAAGTICEVAEPVLAIDTPSWWEPVMVPVWSPDLGENVRLNDGLVAHVSVQTDRPRGRGQTQNALVVFPDLRSGTPFQNLIQALELMRRQTVAPAVLIVMPAGSFDGTRREVESVLAPFPASIVQRLQVVEDTEGGWSRTFDVTGAPSLFLINARREFVWKGGGDLSPADIASALDQHVVPTSRPRFVPNRLRVSPGDRAPDVLFRDDRGGEGALHRLRGRSVLLNFWQSFSVPCRAELRRLQALANANQDGAPFVVAFHGGADPGNFSAVRGALGLTFPIVQDGEHRTARAFGVRCWPTTIAVDPDGIIEHIQTGFRPPTA